MNYFKSLSKEEKKNIKTEFLTTTEGTIYKKINRIFILSIVGIALAVVSFTFDFVYKTGTINFVLDGLLLVFSFLFLLKTMSMKSKEVNKYALEQKEKKEPKSKKKSK